MDICNVLQLKRIFGERNFKRSVCKLDWYSLRVSRKDIKKAWLNTFDGACKVRQNPTYVSEGQVVLFKPTQVLSLVNCKVS